MDAVAGLMGALGAGGPYAMWWLERRDRQEKRRTPRGLREDRLAVETKVTVDKMQGAVTALTDAIRSVNGRLR